MDPISLASLAISGLGTLFGIKSGRDAAKNAKLDPQTLALQQNALRMSNERAQMMQPLLQQLVGGMQGRLAASQGGTRSPYLPSPGQMQSPNMGQALSSMARGLPGPGARRRVRQDMA